MPDLSVDAFYRKISKEGEEKERERKEKYTKLEDTKKKSLFFLNGSNFLYKNIKSVICKV